MLMRLGHGLGMGNQAGTLGPAYLDSVLNSVCCDLDATIAASYPGTGQVWANLIKAPADGANQTDYDFFLGDNATVEGDDPSFVGTPDDPATYWLYGGDKFVNPTTNTPQLFKDFHKTQAGNVWWIALAFKYKAGTNHIFDTRPVFLNQGMSVTTVDPNLRMTFRGGGVNSPRVLAPLTDGDEVLVIITGNGETGQVKYAVNATSLTTDNTAWPNSTVDAANPAAMLADNGLNPNAVNGLRLYHFSAGNEFLDDAKTAAIVAHLEARHGRDYTL